MKQNSLLLVVLVIATFLGARSQLGSPCKADTGSDCNSDADCLVGYCSAAPGYKGKCNFPTTSACGASCDGNGLKSRCAGSLHCSNGRCGNGLDWGCQTTKIGFTALQCKSGQSQNGTCFWPLADQDVCKYNWDCASAVCTGGKCQGLAIGSPCIGGAFSANPCAMGAYCKTAQPNGKGTCTAKIQIGQPCNALDAYNDGCLGGGCDSGPSGTGVCRTFFGTLDGQPCSNSYTDATGSQRVNVNATWFCLPGSVCSVDPKDDTKGTCQRYVAQPCDSRQAGCPIGTACSACAGDGTGSAICQGTQAPTPSAACKSAITKMNIKMAQYALGTMNLYSGLAYSDKTSGIGKYLPKEFAAFVCACGGPTIVPGDASMINCNTDPPTIDTYKQTCDFNSCPTLAAAAPVYVSSAVGSLCLALLGMLLVWGRS